jgi:NDP-sugar pyrophosphorylase family protein
MIAIVLAGGLGTRLRAVVPEGPKCMSLVAGRPFLEHLLGGFRDQGVADFVLAIGFRGAAVREHFGSGERFGVRVRYCDDGEALRGTAGALAGAVRMAPCPPEGLILAANGDTWVDVDLAELEEAHRAEAARVTLVVTPGSTPGAAVEVGPDHRVRRYGHVPAAPELVSAGMYLATREAWEATVLPPGSRAVSLEQDVLPRLARELHAFEASACFVDIGTPAGFHRAQALFAEGQPCR